MGQRSGSPVHSSWIIGDDGDGTSALEHDRALAAERVDPGRDRSVALDPAVVFEALVGAHLAPRLGVGPQLQKGDGTVLDRCGGVGGERDRHGFGWGLDGKAVEATRGIGVEVSDDGGQDCRATGLAGQDCGTGQDEEDILAAFRSVVAKGVGGIVECLAQQQRELGLATLRVSAGDDGLLVVGTVVVVGGGDVAGRGGDGGAGRRGLGADSGEEARRRAWGRRKRGSGLERREG